MTSSRLRSQRGASKRNRRSQNGKPPRNKCSICRRRRRSRYGICINCDRAFFGSIDQREVPRALKRAREIAKEHSMAIEYAVRVATGEYTVEFAERRDRLRKRGEVNLAVKTREIAKTHGLTTELARKVALGRCSLDVAKKNERRGRQKASQKSSDLFVAGRRLPGSYGSNQ